MENEGPFKNGQEYKNVFDKENRNKLSMGKQKPNKPWPDESSLVMIDREGKYHITPEGYRAAVERWKREHLREEERIVEENVNLDFLENGYSRVSQLLDGLTPRQVNIIKEVIGMITHPPETHPPETSEKTPPPVVSPDSTSKTL